MNEADELTQANFNKLPLLLRWKDLVHWGVPRSMVPELIKTGQLTFIEVKSGAGRRAARRHYHKASVARIVGLEA